MKSLNNNVTILYDDLSKSLNNTISLSLLKEFHTNLNLKIKMFEDKVSHKDIMKQKNLKKRKPVDDNRFNFYNSISLIMLGLLAGGLVGVVFILYFSFKNQDKE
jgi:hypothetical protein